MPDLPVLFSTVSLPLAEAILCAPAWPLPSLPRLHRWPRYMLLRARLACAVFILPLLVVKALICAPAWLQSSYIFVLRLAATVLCTPA